MSTTLVGSERPPPTPSHPVGTVEMPRAERRSFVRPAAVLVPPIVSAACVCGGAALTQGAVAAGPWWPAAFASLVLLGLLYVQRTVMIGNGCVRAAPFVSLAAGAAWVGLFTLLAPSEMIHPAALVVSLLLALAATNLAPRWRRRLMTCRRIPVTLLAGSELSAQAALQRIDGLHAFNVVSILLPGRVDMDGQRVLGRPVASTLLCDVPLERRIVVSRPARNEQVEACVAQLVARGHEIRSESAATRLLEGRVDSIKADPLGLLMGLRHSRTIEWVCVGLASLCALMSLVLLAPLFLLIGAAIVIESGLPVFYSQPRVGWRGRIFDVLKFRTMRQDAEGDSGPVFATEEDPRITRVGRVLRHYRLDELAQLVNVARGEMGLVGPRPERPHFFQLFRDDVPLFELRTCVRPGITGWAQVRMPYAVDADDARAKLEHDLYYVTRRSLVFDLAILFDTVNVALSGAGAR